MKLPWYLKMKKVKVKDKELVCTFTISKVGIIYLICKTIIKEIRCNFGGQKKNQK